MVEDAWNSAWGRVKLKTTWSPEMAQDLAALGIGDVESQLISILSDELAKEIDTEILNALRPNIKTGEEFINVVKCIGYEPSEAILDPATFMVRKGFVSMNYNEMLNERQNNPHWQDWIRTREQDKKT